MSDLLISSTQRFIHWDGRQNTIVKRSNAYGLTWDKDTIYYSWNPLDVNVTIIEKFGKDFVPQEKLLSGEQWNCHQIYFWKKWLYLTLTGLKKIARYDFKELKIHELDKGIKSHCNSIFAYKGHIYFINSTSTFPATAIKFDEELNNFKCIPVQEPEHIFHNIYIENDVFYGCCHPCTNEGTSNLYRYDLNEKKGELFDIRKDTENGFLRGLARTKDYFFIGESQHNPIRSERAMGNSRVLVIDNDMKLVDTIELEDTGQIREVRLMKGDLAHNGIDF